jgi:hypothetical protein
MPEFTQLELDLQPYLKTARAFPEAAEMRELLALLDQCLVDQPLSKQLEIAGHAMTTLSEVFGAKAQKLLDRWETRWNPREPIVVDLTTCVDLFVQGQQFQLAELFEESEEHYYPENRQSCAPSNTVVVEVPHRR